MGMTGASIIGHELGLTGRDVVDRQRRVLERFGLPTAAGDVEPEDLFRAMSLDKKTESGSIRWVMLEDVGRAVVTRDVPGDLVERTVRGLLGP